LLNHSSQLAISIDPSKHEAWYHTRRGIWIGNTEFNLVKKLLRASPGNSLPDVSCGTGYFSHRFVEIGLAVSGIIALAVA
jgi:2-polyprenyl-3-methyl-5-hydroxy-6-metoxy-1,4-benzoquinol methylase